MGMIGLRNVKIRTLKVNIDLQLKRKFTLIAGDSATGKTVFRNLLLPESHAKIICDINISVLPTSKSQYRYVLEHAHNEIFVIDETVEDLNTYEFSQLVRKSDCYFILETREFLAGIPVSVKEYYKFCDRDGVTCLTEYFSYDTDTIKESQRNLTEDKNSGNQFFSFAFDNECDSFCGLANFYKINDIIDHDLDYSIIVDGAAFGMYLPFVFNIKCKRLCIYMPESFEYLLLKTGYIMHEDIDLDNIYYYCDNSTFDLDFATDGFNRTTDIVSWENFYYEFLRYSTWHDYNFKYNKSILSKSYLTKRFVDSVLSIKVPCLCFDNDSDKFCESLNVF